MPGAFVLRDAGHLPRLLPPFAGKGGVPPDLCLSPFLGYIPPVTCEECRKEIDGFLSGGAVAKGIEE